MADVSRSSSSSDSDSANETEIRTPKQPVQSAANAFKNDGSFMEMFKKMQDERNKKDSNYFDNTSSVKNETSNSTSQAESVPENTETEAPSTSQPAKKTSIVNYHVGKRRGGRILPTGTVKKPKKPDPASEEGEKNDAWSRYLNEVKKYREQSCEEEGKRRPLVK